MHVAFTAIGAVLTKIVQASSCVDRLKAYLSNMLFLRMFYTSHYSNV